jgi:Ca2+-binding RTX toxin-like protein
LWVEPGSRADWEIKGDVNGDGSADFAISVRASNGEQIMEGAIVGASLASGPRDVVVEEAGGLRTIHYDAAGMIIGSDLAVGNRTVYYDANNILLRSTITDRDGAGNDRLIIYGSRNELLGAKVTYYRQDGVRIDTQYDAMWKVTSRTSEGTGGDDTVYSGIGENILIGEDGNDTLAGNNGDDVLIGGKGADRLKGAGGADRFVFEEISDLSATRGTSDQILDFSAGQGDRIDLSGLDANLLIEGDQAFTFFRSAPSTPSAGALWIEAISTKNVNLLGDIDGDGSADFLIHVTSIVVETLPHSGFIL